MFEMCTALKSKHKISEPIIITDAYPYPNVINSLVKNNSLSNQPILAINSDAQKENNK